MPYASYKSAPNDVWSLGVILVNLTCGRNPWKRASMDDTTFKAFRQDSNFLQTILPISDDLNAILKRVFDVNAETRITLPELRSLILNCSNLTGNSGSSSPATPPYSPAQESLECGGVLYTAVPETVPPMDQLPAQQYPVARPVYHSPQQSVFPAVYPTPPASGNNNPYHHPYTFTGKAAAPQPAPRYPAPQTSFFQTPPVWQRCSQFLPSLTRPICWTPGPGMAY